MTRLLYATWPQLMVAFHSEELSPTIQSLLLLLKLVTLLITENQPKETRYAILTFSLSVVGVRRKTSNA